MENTRDFVFSLKEKKKRRLNKIRDYSWNLGVTLLRYKIRFGSVSYLLLLLCH